MANYIEEFHRLGARTNLMENEQHLIARFVGGLRMDIKEKVELQPFHFLAEAISFAETLEEMNDIWSKNLSRRGPWKASMSKKQTIVNKAANPTHPPSLAKGKDKEVQEEAEEQRTEAVNKGRRQNPYNRPSLGKCFRCSQVGHLSNSCPQRKTVAYLEDEEENMIEGR